MVARIWRGWTRAADTQRYLDYLERTGLADYRATPGNLGAAVLTRAEGERTEFLTLSLWASREAIASFAGEAIERAVFYPEDEAFLVAPEETVTHYELTGALAPGRELRVAVTTRDLEAALALYRDALGLPVIAEWPGEDGPAGVVLAAGRGTLELLTATEAARVDEIEVGRRVTDGVRLALEVPDAGTAAAALEAAGGERLGGPVTTPWGDRNARVRAPDGLQLTLFTPGAGTS